jgi:hypothetical protein
MSQIGRVEPIRVDITTTPRLLGDLIASALDDPALRRWAPGDAPALISIVDAEAARTSRSRVTIVLGDRLDEPVCVIVDGEPTIHAPTRPTQLTSLVLDLAHEVSARPGREVADVG